MEWQVYKTVLHSKMKDFPDGSVTVFIVFPLRVERKFA